MRNITPLLVIGLVAFLLIKSNKSGTTEQTPIPDLPDSLRGVRNVSL